MVHRQIQPAVIADSHPHLAKALKTPGSRILIVHYSQGVSFLFRWSSLLPPDPPLTDSTFEPQPGPGAQVNFPSVLHVGRHVDGDTDEINVIICTQRSRRRYAGELPRCYTLGWRHINNFEVPPLGKPAVMPPKLGQQREVPGFWKERIVGSRDVPTWEGDQDEDGEGAMERALNIVEKPEMWTEGNYVSVGTGSSSAHEKILAMNVPLHSYDVHRRFREELWTAEKVAENMTKHHANLHKQRLQTEQQKKRSEKTPAPIVSAASTVSQSTTAEQSSRLTTNETSTKEPATVTSLASTASTSSTVKAKTFTAEEKDASQSTSSQPSPSPSPPPPPPAPAATAAAPPAPVDRRFAPERIARLPWYRKLYNYTPPPTGWTSDEAYGHRTYIIPHPLHAAKENLMRSWAVVLTPTWKLTKALATSFTSGSQRRFYDQIWSFSREGGHVGLMGRIRTEWKKKIREETERIEKEKRERGEGSPSSDANGGSSASSG